MHTFFAVFLLGIAVGCAFAGWGSLVVSILKIRFSTGVGFDAAVGIALTTAVGAFLNLFQLISPRVVQAWVGAGVLLLFVAAMRSAGKIGEAFTSLRTSLKHPQPYLLLVFGIVAVSGVKFAASTCPPTLCIRPRCCRQGRWEMILSVNGVSCLRWAETTFSTLLWRVLLATLAISG
jgi:hypothetical protein